MHFGQRNRHTLSHTMPYEDSTLYAKFGPPPSSSSSLGTRRSQDPHLVLAVQFAVVVLLLSTLRPSFVLRYTTARGDGQVVAHLSLRLVLAAAAASVLCTQRLHAVRSGC